MAKMFVKYKITPSSPEADLENIEKINEETLDSFNKDIQIKEKKINEIGFGIKELEFMIYLDESVSTEEIENELNKHEQIGEAKVFSLDRE